MTRKALGSPPSPRPPTGPRPPKRFNWVLFAVYGLAIILLFVVPLAGSGSSQTLSYTRFLSEVGAHKVSAIQLSSDGSVAGTLKSGADFTTVIPSSLAGPNLLTRLQDAHVDITAVAATTSGWSTFLSWAIILVPLLLIGWLWWRLSRSAAKGGSGLFGMGRSKAKRFEASTSKTTFADVAGYGGVKAEVSEIVDFLRNPDRYRKVGAQTPRGEIMTGPPGTGKTLLARAVAGEANVPFYSVEGSSFVEMFVGVGASRVRDLFAEVRKHAPAILFIDEIDAIGQRRSGASAFVSNDEREQTLNQLLAEMDGFEGSTGIVVLAATNRPEVLDPALLRPGRFDRHITVPLPTVDDRTQILTVHSKGKPLDRDVDLPAIARATPGFSGADLANLTNEAAIEAVRAGRSRLTRVDFDNARDRLILGRRDTTNLLLTDEKHAVAVHEAGHALVAALCPHADPVGRITILPAGESLGATEQLPLEERHLHTEDMLTDALAVRLGGRAAELVVFGQGSSGAASDLASATALATTMIREFGLSPRLGPVSYPTQGDTLTSGQTLNRPFAEATQAIVDEETSRLLREAETRAIDLLTKHRKALDKLATLLIEQETIEGALVYGLLGIALPEATGAAALPAPENGPERRALAPANEA